MARLAAFIAELRGWRRALVGFAAGAATVLAFAPFQLWPVLLLTLPILVWLLDGVRPDAAHGGRAPTRFRSVALPAALDGWWFGFGFFLAGLHWIGFAFLVEAEKFLWLLPFAVSLLPAGLALFFAGAAAAARCYWPRGMERVVVLAIALTMSEWLRGHILTGFPWNVLGYALTGNLAMMQSAAVIGIYGLTFWAVIVGAGPLVVLAEGRRDVDGQPATPIRALVPLLPLLVIWSYGSWRLKAAPPEPIDGVVIRIVQPSVPQREKWRPENQRAIFLDHLALSRQRPDGSAEAQPSVTHIVWPEAAMPFRPLATPEALRLIGEMLGPRAILLAGALREEPAGPTTPRRVFNSLMAFDGSGQAIAINDKNHLVPFGEYLPFQHTLERIGLEALTRMRGGFAEGQRPRPLMTVPGLGMISGLICYEAIFPAAIIQVRERPRLLINVTNDGWFGPTIGPEQHMHMARVRAVEEGISLVRAANNGISALVDPYGRLIASLGLNVRGVIEGPLPGPIAPPLYARHGDLLALLQAVIAVCLLLALRRQGPTA